VLEIDRFRDELRCSVLCGTAATIIIAIIGDHHYRHNPDGAA